MLRAKSGFRRFATVSTHLRLIQQSQLHPSAVQKPVPIGSSLQFQETRDRSSWCQSDSSTQRLPTTCKEQAKESFYILLSTVHPFNLFHSWLTCRALWWIWGEDFQVESSTQGCTQGCAQEPRRHRSTRFHFSCHGTSAGPVIFVPPLARSRGTNSGGGTKTM